jgi:predicted permease
MCRLIRRLVHLCRRRQFEHDLQEEMRIHREMMSEERRRSFGSGVRLMEDARDAWGWGWLDAIRHDLSYGTRQLRRAPAFTLTAIAVLAVGVGLNLAMFHVVKGIAAARTPVPDADSLVRVVRQSADGESRSFPWDAVRFLQEHADVFAHLVGERLGSIRVQVNDDETEARVQFVTGNYFSDLGVRAGHGRLLDTRDDEPGAQAVAVLSDGYWHRRFGGDPAIVSATIDINGVPALVAGILPPGFAGLSMSRGDLWLPVTLRAQLLGEATTAWAARPDIGLAGRLRPGMSLEAARTRLVALTSEFRAQFPVLFDDGVTLTARPLADDNRGPDQSGLLVVLVVLVLLAACANLGNMLLARGLARQPELSTRVAIGASRARLVRQLMTECLLLSALGGLVGLVVGSVGARLLATVFASWLNLAIVIDAPVILAAVVLSIVSALAFGLVPALQTTGSLRQVGRSRGRLLGIQVATSCVLLVLSGLMVRGAERQAGLAARDDFASLVVLEPGLEDAQLPAPALRDTLDDTVRRLRTLPGVTAVTVSDNPIYDVLVESAPGMRTIVRARVAADYFRVMRLAPVRGRLFQPGDEDVAVLSLSAARAAFGGDEVVGRVWRPGNEVGGPVVIGVVDDSAFAAMRDPGAVEVYVPMTDADLAGASVILRTMGDGRALLRQVREAAPPAGVLPSVWVMQTPVDQMLQHAIAATRVIGTLGLSAAGLAALGLFGLMAYTVRERTREVAIRLALGARARAIAAMLVARYARPMGIGVVVGTVAAAAGAHVVGGLGLGLGIRTFDAAGYILGLFVFAATAAVAVFVPLRRAMRIAPAATSILNRARAARRPLPV